MRRGQIDRLSSLAALQASASGRLLQHKRRARPSGFYVVSLPTSLCSAPALQVVSEQQAPGQPWAQDVGEEQGWEKMDDIRVRLCSGGKPTVMAQRPG